MRNDELFFLCVLTGAEEILGVEDPLKGMSEQEAKLKWESVSNEFYEQGILFDDEQGEMCISDEYAKIAAAISFPDIAYVSPVNEDMTNYIYIKGTLFVQLKCEEANEVKLYDNQEEFITFLLQEFNLTPCEDELFLELPLDTLDDAVEMFLEGNSQKAVEGLEEHGVSTEHAETLLELFTNTEQSKNFVGSRPNQEVASEAVFKAVKTEEGTWLFKAIDTSMKVLRVDKSTALAEVIYF